MKIIYSDKHILHNPVYEYEDNIQSIYLEAPIRAEKIYTACSALNADVIQPHICSIDDLCRVHSHEYLSYLSSVYKKWITHGYPEEGVIPRDVVRKQNIENDIFEDVLKHTFDVSTPIVEGTYEASHGAASCARSGAHELKNGEKFVYALTRPPGHHAGIDYCAGYCYFNNAAIAAAYIINQTDTRVAILDIDYHHGNGTQELFYASDKVFFSSIHADTRFEYPGYSGEKDETGSGKGRGFTKNFPLPLHTTAANYRETVAHACESIAASHPSFLIVSLGVDTFIDDPLGTFELTIDDFALCGNTVREMNLPTLIVQEGGYNYTHIGDCVYAFLNSLTTEKHD